MATVSEIKKFISNLKDNDTIYIYYNDFDELECTFFTKDNIIDMANEKGGEKQITDVDSALQYLADIDEDCHFLEINL